mmetsp:Transcript_8104/g.16208  ORF Transcript_8104/g.16208 Transcript_8104/m.16208 type:complete len:225 (-) Transcript_8104:215-889(-)
MVEVVELGGRKERKVVARVHLNSNEDGDEEPEPVTHNVRAHEPRPGHQGKKVGGDVLNRVSVYGHKADGGGPLVVLLVEVLVEERPVHHAVSVIESNLLDYGENGQVDDEGAEGRDVLRESRHVSGLGNGISHVGKRAVHRDLVEEAGEGGPNQLLGVHRLVGVLDLPLVSPREVLRKEVQETKGEAMSPEGRHVVELRAHDDDEKGCLGIISVGPCSLYVVVE